MRRDKALHLPGQESLPPPPSPRKIRRKYTGTSFSFSHIKDAKAVPLREIGRDNALYLSGQESLPPPLFLDRPSFPFPSFVERLI